MKLKYQDMRYVKGRIKKYMRKKWTFLGTNDEILEITNNKYFLTIHEY